MLDRDYADIHLDEGIGGSTTANQLDILANAVCDLSGTGDASIFVHAYKFNLEGS